MQRAFPWKLFFCLDSWTRFVSDALETASCLSDVSSIVIEICVHRSVCSSLRVKSPPAFTKMAAMKKAMKKAAKAHAEAAPAKKTMKKAMKAKK